MQKHQRCLKEQCSHDCAVRFAQQNVLVLAQMYLPQNLQVAEKECIISTEDRISPSCTFLQLCSPSVSFTMVLVIQDQNENKEKTKLLPPNNRSFISFPSHIFFSSSTSPPSQTPHSCPSTLVIQILGDITCNYTTSLKAEHQRFADKKTLKPHKM